MSQTKTHTVRVTAARRYQEPTQEGVVGRATGDIRRHQSLAAVVEFQILIEEEWNEIAHGMAIAGCKYHAVHVSRITDVWTHQPEPVHRERPVEVETAGQSQE